MSTGSSLITVEQYAIKHSVSVDTVQLWMKHGRLKRYKCGRRTLVNENEPRPEKGSRWHGARIKQVTAE